MQGHHSSEMGTADPCRLCLSTERVMFSIEDVRWAYCALTDTMQSNDGHVSLAAVRVCWECRAALHRVLRLRSQAQRAQWALTSHLNELFPPQCLSSLSCSTKTYFDQDVKENMEYWNTEKENPIIDPEEVIKNEMDSEALDFEVFAESAPSDMIEPIVTEVKVNEIKLKVELKAESAQEKIKSLVKPKRSQKRTKTEVSKETERGVKRKRSKAETNPHVEVIKKDKKKTPKKFDISNLCEKVVNATTEQLIEKRVLDDKESHYHCVVCGSTFIGEEESLSHLEKHRANGSCAVLRCRLCAHLTGDADAMRRHHEDIHPPTGRRAGRSTTGKSTTVKSSTGKSTAVKSTTAKKSMTGFDCDVCGLHVKTYDYYKVHCKTHTHARTYQCDICKATYVLRTQILVHLKRHDMRFLCDICGKRFKDKSSLSTHYLCHSSIDARPYACKLCPRKFITKDKLVVHMTFHEGVKPFKCDLCDRRFRMKFDLTRHKKLRHSTGEPVETKKMTRTKSLFRNEKLLIDDKTGEIRVPNSTQKRKTVKQQTFQCNLCGKKYAQKKGLEAHTVFHTGERPHKCDECGLTFKYTAGLWSHKLLHRGVKPHQCTVCGAQFTLKGNLKGHMKIHSNDKPYECDICGQRFPWRKNLRNHFKVHTK